VVEVFATYRLVIHVVAIGAQNTLVGDAVFPNLTGALRLLLFARGQQQERAKEKNDVFHDQAHAFIEQLL
jgi:ribosomal protein L1